MILADFKVHGLPRPQGSLKPMPAESDSSRALTLIRGLIGEGADPNRMNFVVHEGCPFSKSRARHGRHSTYTPAKTTEAQRSLAAVLDGFDREESNVAIIAIFFRPNRQRIDADNMMKLVMDACTQAGLWHDDCQVTAQASLVELDAARPRTVIAWCPAKSTLDRSYKHIRACVICAAEFYVQVMHSRTREDKRRLTCSDTCSQRLRARMQRKAFDEDGFCKRGHAWTPETTSMRLGKYRACIACRTMLNRESYMRRKDDPVFRKAKREANRRYEQRVRR